MKSLINQLRAARVNLPNEYLDCIGQDDFKGTYTLPEDEEAFEIYPLHSLAEKISIDQNLVLTAQMLKAHVNALREFLGKDTYDQKGEPYSLDRLAKSVAIGKVGSRILFVDSKGNKRLCVFHPNGGDVELTKKSVEDLLGSLTQGVV